MKNFTILASFILYSQLMTAQWINQNPGGEGNFADIHFIDENFGWAIKSADYPDVYYTTNGGEEWAWCFEFFGLLQGPGTAVYFSDADNGWMSDGNNIIHTGNGSTGCGAEWTDQIDESPGCQSSKLFFADETHGWFVGGYDGGCDIYLSRFFRTVDGGQSWIFSDAYGYRISDIVFSDSLQGWALDMHTIGLQGPSGLWRSTDGGQSWTVICDTVYGSAMCFPDSQHGWVAGYDPDNGSGFIRHTSDGGYSWIKQTNGALPALTDIVFTDNQTGWAIGDGGTILHTGDGGMTWEPQESGTNANLNSISFVGANHGWISGQGGVILHTDNGGLVGVNEFEGPEQYLFSVSPNPASDYIHVYYKLTESGKVSITITNSLGREMENISLNQTNQGKYTFDSRMYLPGMYFITLQTDYELQTEKVIIK
jgi:photosystem II stability/assembly factor-like uncharacterized protein